MEDIEEQLNLLQNSLPSPQETSELKQKITLLKIYNIYCQILIILGLCFYILCGREIHSTYESKNFNFQKLLLICLIYHIILIVVNLFFGCLLRKNGLASFCKNIIVSIGMYLVYLGFYLFLHEKIDQTKVFIFMIPYILLNLIFVIKSYCKELMPFLAFVESIFILLIGLEFSGIINIGYTFPFFYYYLGYGIGLFCLACCLLVVFCCALCNCNIIGFIIGTVVIAFAGLFVVLNFMLTYGFCWLFNNNEIFVNGIVSDNKLLFVTGEIMEVYGMFILVLFVLLMICCNKVFDFSAFYYGGNIGLFIAKYQNMIKENLVN